MKKILFGGLLSIAVLSAGGNEVITTSDVIESDYAPGGSSIGLFGGTEGVGVSYSRRIDTLLPNTALTLSASGLSGYSRSFTNDGVRYDADLDLLNAGATLDYHPFCNGFFLSAGAFYNGNKVKATAKAERRSITINGNTYSTDDLGYVRGETDFSKFAPYVGIGYDNSLFGSGNWFFTARAGAIYQGSANIKLDYECGATARRTGLCTDIKRDVLEAQKSLNDKVDDYKFYPVVSVGITYKF